MNTRRKKLLLEIASDYDRASIPMNTEWLSKNEVSLDECGALCDQLGAIIKGFAQAPREIQTLILISSAADDAEQAEFLVANVSRSMAMSKVITRLKSVLTTVG